MKKTTKIIIAVLVLVGAIMVSVFWQKPQTAQASWYNNVWNYRVKITIQATQVSADFTDFPVYVDLSTLPAEFHTNVNQTDARDIRVTTDDGLTEVPREVVWYDSATDTGEIHFKAPSVSSTTDTVFYIYYGNAAASEPAADATYGSQNVYTASTTLAMHLQTDTASSTPDSTAYAKNGTLTGNASTTAGQIGQAMSFDGLDKVFIDPNWSGFNNNFTLNIWAKKYFPSANYQHLVATYNGFGGNRFALDYNATSIFATIGSNNISYNFTADSAWHYITVTRSTTGTAQIFVDGVLRVASTTLATGTLSYGGNNDLALAETYDQYFKGLLDDFRIYDRVLSAQEISALYINQNTPTSFYTVGGEETEVIPPVEKVNIRINAGSKIKIKSGGTIRINN